MNKKDIIEELNNITRIEGYNKHFQAVVNLLNKIEQSKGLIEEDNNDE